MCKQKEYYCPNPECGNMAFEPGLCSGCGAELEEAEMIGTEETVEGYPPSAGFAPRTPHSKAIDELLAELLAELPPGRNCPTCGGMMAHGRLRGYYCLAGCNYR